MKLKRRHLLLAASLVLISLLASGQSVPQLINYQGRLTNAAGIPLDGVSVDLTFRFYSAETAGDLYLTVSQTNVQVSKGIYNLLIGSGAITPGTESILAGVFQKHCEVWMSVQVGTDPEMIPRSRIASAAYALRSGFSDSAGISNIALMADAVAPGSIMASNIGENCAPGEVLVKSNTGWRCAIPGALYAWTWMSGTSATNQYGVYGTKGTPDQINLPGARYGAVSWTDSSENLWLFSGNGYATSSSGNLNDLWKWDGTNWTWISGSNGINQYGVYGGKGIPAPANVPGARNCAISWTDASGNLWLFGGSGRAASSSGYLNDLWKFDGTNWTWISGSNEANQYGTYGKKGTPDPANVPGARDRAVSWTDASGNLWLFGGRGYATNSSGNLNDVWKFDGTNWTWISGLNDINQYGAYGSKGIPDPANVPGARYSDIAWGDSSGNLWIFGGIGCLSGYGCVTTLNDLWKFDGTNWTWISGSNEYNQYGVYGTKGTPDPANVPGERSGAISWIDSSGNLLLFGGNGRGASSTGYLNDLWKFDGNNWIWMSGSNQANQFGAYGTKENPGPGNTPGARRNNVSWKDTSGNLWIFGGEGYVASGSSGDLNDLWKYVVSL